MGHILEIFSYNKPFSQLFEHWLSWNQRMSLIKTPHFDVL